MEGVVFTEQASPMMVPLHAPLAAVAPLLEPGERVWAVYPSGPRPIVATARRVFLIGPSGVDAVPLAELSTVRRQDNDIVVVERAGRPLLAVPVDPADEYGLQALTVIGLLVATARSGSDPDAAAGVLADADGDLDDPTTIR